MRICVRLLIVASLLPVLAGRALSAGEDVTAAVDAVTPWLALVDSGQYGESWFQASSDFRGAASKEQWIHALNTVRAPLGTLVSRHLKSATHTTKLPNARPGDYVVVQYDTSYEKAPGMLEVVVAILEKDGAWKVSGYFIKRPGQ